MISQIFIFFRIPYEDTKSVGTISRKRKEYLGTRATFHIFSEKYVKS